MRYIYFVLTGLLLWSCKKSDQVDMELDYYPDSTGHYVIYKVREIHTDVAVNQHDTLNYYVKARIGDTISDNENRLAKRYERYYGNSANGPWNIHDIWTTIVVSNRAELVEENNRTIKVVFKPTDSKEWNCNAYNTLDPLTCYYVNIGEPYSLNGLHFDQTIQVEQEDELNYIEYKRKYEIYAKGVGLVYKCYKDLKITGYDINNVQKGTDIVMEAVAYGQE